MVTKIYMGRSWLPVGRHGTRCQKPALGEGKLYRLTPLWRLSKMINSGSGNFKTKLITWDTKSHLHKQWLNLDRAASVSYPLEWQQLLNGLYFKISQPHKGIVHDVAVVRGLSWSFYWYFSCGVILIWICQFPSLECSGSAREGITHLHQFHTVGNCTNQNSYVNLKLHSIFTVTLFVWHNLRQTIAESIWKLS